MAEGRVRARVDAGVAVLRLSGPPANTLNAPLRSALAEALEHFLADDAVTGIVIGAEGDEFSAGADLRELGSDAAAVSLSALCQRIEHAPKTIVAALPGAALGAGAELALAAHYRVANRAVKLGFQDIALGLPPGAGGTQRLPRLVGPRVAIQMMQSGRPVDEMVAQRIGLIDHLVHDDVLSKAADIARNKPPRPVTGMRDHTADGAAYMRAVAAARRSSGNGYAKARIVDCVEAALLLPPEAAMDYEQGAYAECLAHRESRALRHLALAERRAPPELTADRKPTPRGQTIVARLYAAQDKAILALIKGGLTEADIDGAMVALGYAAGPFGGREASDGPMVQTIQRRIVAAIMAEGARCLEQRLVTRASDLDVLAVHAMGFPRLWGGPMKAAELLGLLGLSRQMADWAKEDPVWQVSDTLRTAVMQADGFAAV